MKTFQIVVPWDPHRTSDNALRRLHWAARSELNRTARMMAQVAWANAGWPKAAGRVRASFLVRRGRQMDPANALGGLKPVIDGLFVRAVTKDDSARWLEIGGIQIETRVECPEVIVTIEELG